MSELVENRKCLFLLLFCWFVQVVKATTLSVGRQPNWSTNRARVEMVGQSIDRKNLLPPLRCIAVPRSSDSPSINGRPANRLFHSNINSAGGSLVVRWQWVAIATKVNQWKSRLNQIPNSKKITFFSPLFRLKNVMVMTIKNRLLSEHLMPPQWLCRSTFLRPVGMQTNYNWRSSLGQTLHSEAMHADCTL